LAGDQHVIIIDIADAKTIMIPHSLRHTRNTRSCSCRTLPIYISTHNLRQRKVINDKNGDKILTCINVPSGRAIAQAVSCRLPTAAARVQTRVWSHGIL
jgi:hypothetical protein